MLSEILAVFFPNTCIGCGTVIAEDEFLCDYCMEMTEHCDLGKFCFKCGNIKENCRCSSKVFHFDGCVAPFLNKGAAKRSMYSFKFRHQERIAEYFAKNMSLTLKQCFYDVNFDAVCCVPIEKHKGLKRGYNQSFVIAKRVAKILNLPFYGDVFTINKRKRTQHKTFGEERFKNVKDAYKVKYPLENKTVLLIDDIKTTGATLDECAKQLLATGSNKVYCLTGLVTDKKGNKNGS